MHISEMFSLDMPTVRQLNQMHLFIRVSRTEYGKNMKIEIVESECYKSELYSYCANIRMLATQIIQ